MEKRITKRDNYNELRGIAIELGREDLIKFIDHEIELLDRKANRTTLTKTQKENIEITEVIYNVIAKFDEPATLAEIYEDETLSSNYSTQKVTALINNLVKAGRVIRTENKNKSYYSIAD